MGSSEQPEWTPKKIREAVHAGTERHVALKEPLPVHTFISPQWSTMTACFSWKKMFTNTTIADFESADAAKDRAWLHIQINH